MKKNKENETVIAKGFILVTTAREINTECFSSDFVILDNNRNYIATHGKIKYINDAISFETANMKTEEQLMSWYNNPNKALEDLTDQDKRNLITMAGFRLDCHNTLDYYYFIKTRGDSDNLSVENKKFANIDEVIIELDTFLIEYYNKWKSLHA